MKRAFLLALSLHGASCDSLWDAYLSQPPPCGAGTTACATGDLAQPADAARPPVPDLAAPPAVCRSSAECSSASDWCNPRTQACEPLPTLRSVYLPDSNTVWAVGDKGLILKLADATNAASTWQPMERLLADADMTEFFRQYLMRDGTMVKIDAVYVELKRSTDRRSQLSPIEQLQELHRYAEFYSRITHPDREPNPQVRQALALLRRLNFGIIGANGMGWSDARSLLRIEGTQCVAVADVEGGRRHLLELLDARVRGERRVAVWDRRLLPARGLIRGRVAPRLGRAAAREQRCGQEQGIDDACSNIICTPF